MHDSQISLAVFPKPKPEAREVFVFPGDANAEAALEALGIAKASGNIRDAAVILVSDPAILSSESQTLSQAVRAGAVVVLLPLPTGQYTFGDAPLEVRASGMGARHFVSCDSGHPMVAGFQREDFKFWFNEQLGYASPILSTVLEAPEWNPIMLSGDGGWARKWGPVPVAVERRDGKGCWRVCQVDLLHSLRSNPAAHIFALGLLLPPRFS